MWAKILSRVYRANHVGLKSKGCRTSPGSRLRTDWNLFDWFGLGTFQIQENAQNSVSCGIIFSYRPTTDVHSQTARIPYCIDGTMDRLKAKYLYVIVIFSVQIYLAF